MADEFKIRGRPSVFVGDQQFQQSHSSGVIPTAIAQPAPQNVEMSKTY